LRTGGKVLKLYETDLNPDWPRIVLMDLTAKEFEDLHRDPLGFATTNALYPSNESPSWTSHVAMPPIGKGIPQAADDSNWTAVAIHTKDTIVSFAAVPQKTKNGKTK
jgi:hypothetical protein